MSLDLPLSTASASKQPWVSSLVSSLGVRSQYLLFSLGSGGVFGLYGLCLFGTE